MKRQRMEYRPRERSGGTVAGIVFGVLLVAGTGIGAMQLMGAQTPVAQAQANKGTPTGGSLPFKPAEPPVATAQPAPEPVPYSPAPPVTIQLQDPPAVVQTAEPKTRPEPKPAVRLGSGPANPDDSRETRRAEPRVEPLQPAEKPPVVILTEPMRSDPKPVVKTEPPKVEKPPVVVKTEPPKPEKAPARTERQAEPDRLPERVVPRHERLAPAEPRLAEPEPRYRNEPRFNEPELPYPVPRGPAPAYSPRSAYAAPPPVEREEEVRRSGSRVFVHYRAGSEADRQRAIRAAQHLRSQGVNVVEIRGVDHPIRGGSVRYFREEDRAGGDAVTRSAKRFFDDEYGYGEAPAQPRGFSGYAGRASPGTVELWLPSR